ncbi:MAG: hypothetical protein ACTSRS_17620 [Candidatus Helarchaeota archaeon]
MGRKKKKVDLGPFREDEVISVRKKPKKHKGLPEEPWLKKEKYYQDRFDEKDKKDAKRELGHMYDDYYDDYYEPWDSD